MKYLRIVVMFTAAICCSACASEPAKTKRCSTWNSSSGHTQKKCWKEAVSQLDLNGCAGDEVDAADDELNRVYRSIKIRYKEDAIFLKYLKASQLAWIKFSDAQLEMRYPTYPGDPRHYGSIHPMCYGLYRAKLIRERINVLEEWLTTEYPGDGESCTGSINVSASGNLKSYFFQGCPGSR